ncbi:MAG: hypothetical protein ACFCD0_27530 [Gemmataceae bacterium]
MNDPRWEKTTNAIHLFQLLAKREQVSERKLRLFAVALARHYESTLTSQRSRRAIDVAEKFADGQASREQLIKAGRSASAAYVWNHQQKAREAARMAAYVDPWSAAAYTFRRVSNKLAVDQMREIFGNPFQPTTIEPRWLTFNNSIVLQLAERMYDNNDFVEMPILADALEEAGCEDETILRHCRSGGTHARGCWVIDLLLSKR